MIRNQQQNTYDVSFYGANTFVGGLYLAGLKAAAMMALNMRDTSFADSCRIIFETGRQFSSEQLWNGHYFIQQVDLQQHPHGQYSDGCLSDQLFGQTWAHLLNLGYIYPEDKVKQALQAIRNYNCTKDVAAYNTLYPPDRIFARDGDAGLINCTWPVSKHPGKKAIPYRDEVWTGVEYQVATNMIYDGMVNEGLSIVKAIHERYNPERHNPWNEIECGDHYARALASWGVLLALEDYHYDGPKGLLSFAPKIQQKNFNGFFTAAKGWGNLIQRRSKNKQLNEVQVAFGELRLTKVQLQIETDPKKITVQVNDRQIPFTWKREEKKLTIGAIDEVLLRDNQRLTIQINF
jgi:non-lysosomal glucosylceramidase